MEERPGGDSAHPVCVFPSPGAEKEPASCAGGLQTPAGRELKVLAGFSRQGFTLSYPAQARDRSIGRRSRGFFGKQAAVLFFLAGRSAPQRDPRGPVGDQRPKKQAK